jgi:hypothetical protein
MFILIVQEIRITSNSSHILAVNQENNITITERGKSQEDKIHIHDHSGRAKLKGAYFKGCLFFFYIKGVEILF